MFFRPSFSLACRRFFRAYTLLILAWAFASSGVARAALFPSEPPEGLSRVWAFDAGVAFITSNNVDDFLHGRVNVSDGDAGGQVYRFTASRLVHAFSWETGIGVMRPQVELPFAVELIDEIGSSPFLDYNAGLTLRWVNFPWNHRVYTTLASGVGLSYSSRVMAMDKERHPDEDRSHLKFDWPIQLTLARPETPHHQLVLFIAHHSGGHVFDQGGVNSLGLGYRFGFE